MVGSVEDQSEYKTKPNLCNWLRAILRAPKTINSYLTLTMQSILHVCLIIHFSTMHITFEFHTEVIINSNSLFLHWVHLFILISYNQLLSYSHTRNHKNHFYVWELDWDLQKDFGFHTVLAWSNALRSFIHFFFQQDLKDLQSPKHLPILTFQTNELVIIIILLIFDFLKIVAKL